MTNLMANYKTLLSSTYPSNSRLQQMCVNESMQNVMSGMANIMQNANGKMKNLNPQ